MNEPITVSLIEDDAGIRESLALLLQSDANHTLVKPYDSGEVALEDAPRNPPQVMLVDINLPGISGIEAVRRLKALLPETQFIMLTVFEETDRVFEALKAGALGYLTKRATSDQILDAIGEVHGGGSPMTPHIARKVVSSFQTCVSATGVPRLSKRENEVLQLLSSGLTYKEIGGTLGISIDTVRTHLRRVYEKLHVRSRTEAVARFIAGEGRMGPASFGD